jgi:hypothetical protein
VTSFRDAKNREWRIELDDVVLEQVEQQFGFDLLSFDRPPFEQLARNPRQFVKLLAFLCREQSAATGVDDQEFRRSIKPEQLEPAGRALLEALSFFFPPSTRSAWQSLCDRSAELATTAAETALKTMSDPRTRARAERMAEQAIGRELDRLERTFSAPSPPSGDTLLVNPFAGVSTADIRSTSTPGLPALSEPLGVG